MLNQKLQLLNWCIIKRWQNLAPEDFSDGDDDVYFDCNEEYNDDEGYFNTAINKPKGGLTISGKYCFVRGIVILNLTI